ncbi:MAG: benzodiazapine receptor [Verrucomicrobiales bacterium]|jgi:benzodiazapine receptor
MCPAGVNRSSIQPFGFNVSSTVSFWIKVLISIVAVEVLGGMGAAVTSSQIPEWYAGLNKPVGTPPNWIFGPVWITLYALIGISLAIIWHRADSDSGTSKRTALIWFTGQFILNLAWTPLFFGMHQMLFALVVIVALGISIVGTIIHFRRLQPLAGMLLIPYLTWVSYATYLNAGYWWLNR